MPSNTLPHNHNSVTAEQVNVADWKPLQQQLVAAVRLVLEQTPPELSSDIIDKGMVMSGMRSTRSRL